jgi:hypothetical protein
MEDRTFAFPLITLAAVSSQDVSMPRQREEEWSSGLVVK